MNQPDQQSDNHVDDHLVDSHYQPDDEGQVIDNNQQSDNRQQ